MQANPAETYLQEAADLLDEIEAAALSITGAQAGDETIHQLFRAFHTIKGSGAMFGFNEVAAFTHHVETLLDQVREGKVPVSDQLSNVILTSADQIKLLLDASQRGVPVDAGSQASLLDKVRQLSASAANAAVVACKPDTGAQTAPQVWRIHFRPELSLLARGCSPPLLFRDLKKLGECVIEGRTDALPALADLQIDACYLWWTIQLTSPCDLAAIQDVFLFVEDGSELRIEPVEANHIKQQVKAAEADQPAEAPEPETRAPGAPVAHREATVKVPAERLDRLVNLVGELVMNQSRLATAAARFQSPELALPVEEIERLISELRDDVLQIRMMPIGTIFGRFRRLVHDLSMQLGKEIELVTEGEDTELDKSILDQLAEPLVHLLRNSIDHGIESAEKRVAQGKPRQGVIRLVASHRGSDVVVSIEDDGAGMDRAAIRAKAIGRQIIASDANLSDNEILNLILLPGFSTAQTITSVSGRGVGMDVVKRQIDALRGSLSLASEPGRGSRVSLTLPLTLAIIEGLLVEVGESQYILPMAAVTETVELPQKERARNNGRNVIAVRGELIPYIDLRRAFQLDGAGPAISKIVLVQYEGQRVGLVVDRVMGDGRVALILDIASVVRIADDRCQEGATSSGSRPRAA